MLATLGLAGGAHAEPAGNAVAANSATQDLPKVILDESAPNWRVDRFAGNSMGGQQFIQGPARQTAGLNGPVVACAPDGSVFMTAGTESKWVASKIVRVTPDGQLRLLAGGGASLEDGPASRALIRVNTRTAPGLAYSKTDQSVYFFHSTIPCLRRLYQKDGHWMVQTVAGSVTESGTADGTGAAARFLGPRSLAIDRKGVIYILDGNFEKSHWLLRKVEGGKVSTFVKITGGGNVPIDGPIEKDCASIGMCGMIAMGENDDTLYITDFSRFAVRKIDLKTRSITTVAGMPKPKEWREEKKTPLDKRHGANSDGPALTHASFNAGCAFACWDPFRQALWCGGPDETRVRWLKNGEIKTVLPVKGNGIFYGDPTAPMNRTGIMSSEMTPMCWLYVRDIDARGNVYLFNGACPTGVWRAYEIGKEVSK
jgi:hypothetical protein